MDLRRATLIHNPASGSRRSRRRIPAVVSILRGLGVEVETAATDHPGHATELARRAAASGAEAVFTVGGDGTLREAAAGLLGSTVALAPLPAGTANVLARSLGLPRHPVQAARALPRLGVRRIDVGLCGDEPFLMMASTGLDAAVMAHQNGLLKRRIGRLAIAWQGLRELRRYTYPEIEVRCGDALHRAGFVSFCNLPHYGGGFRMAPEADPTDGRLDAVLFAGRGIKASLALARDLVLARHLRRGDVEVLRIESAEILGPPGLPIQLDGDALHFDTPVPIRVAPRRLRVLAPDRR